jgi:hypothetical protein
VVGALFGRGRGGFFPPPPPPPRDRAEASLDHLLSATQIQPNWVQSAGLEPVHGH